MLADPEHAADRRARARGARLLDERAAARAAREARASSTRRARCARSSTSSSRSTDIQTLEDVAGPERLELNDIGVVRLRLSEPLVVDPYAREPRDRRVHPDRRVDERHRRRRHGALRRNDLAVHAHGPADRLARRADRHGRRLADDADPRHPLRLQADLRGRHRHPARRHLQVVRRDPAPAARHGARAARRSGCSLGSGPLSLAGVGVATRDQAPLRRQRAVDRELRGRRRARRRRHRLPREVVHQARHQGGRPPVHPQPRATRCSR